MSAGPRRGGGRRLRMPRKFDYPSHLPDLARLRIIDLHDASVGHEQRVEQGLLR